MDIKKLLLRQIEIEQENMWANVFHDTIRGSRWLQNQPFSPGRAAIGYPALYALYRILDEFQPKSILEMGLGQSTKMIGSYVKWQAGRGEECHHIVVEHDQSWIDFFKNNFALSSESEIIQMDLKKAMFDAPEEGKQTEVNLYMGFAERLSDRKYDLVFVDGPFGSPVYSRIDMIDLIPECLSDSFILLLDDAERKGEQNTLQMFQAIFYESGIEIGMNYYSGMKSTAVITSEDLKFYCTM